MLLTENWIMMILMQESGGHRSDASPSTDLLNNLNVCKTVKYVRQDQMDDRKGGACTAKKINYTFY